jgi:hypothetical protein
MADPSTPLLPGEPPADSPAAADAGSKDSERVVEARAPPKGDASISESEASEADTHPLLRPFKGFLRASDDPFDSVFMRVAVVLIVVFIIYTYLLGRYEFGWGFTDSVYFMVQTVTSIGYGDLVATNDRQRLEVTIYMLLALSIAATALGIVTDYLLGRRVRLRRARSLPRHRAARAPGEKSHTHLIAQLR